MIKPFHNEMALYVNSDHKETPWKADVALMALPNTTRQIWVLEALSTAELLLLPNLIPTYCGTMPSSTGLPPFSSLLNQEKWYSAL